MNKFKLNTIYLILIISCSNHHEKLDNKYVKSVELDSIEYKVKILSLPPKFIYDLVDTSVTMLDSRIIILKAIDQNTDSNLLSLVTERTINQNDSIICKIVGLYNNVFEVYEHKKFGLIFATMLFHQKYQILINKHPKLDSNRMENLLLFCRRDTILTSVPPLKPPPINSN